jgi:hypothetical protein
MLGERRFGSRWLRFAVLVLMLLATIGAWEVVKRVGGYAYADGVNADHLTCYDVKPRGRDDDKGRPDARVAVMLTDQFFPTGVDVDVRHLRLLCTAATKTLR